MKRFVLALALTALPAGAALAATLADLDTDKSAALSLAELQVAYPKLTEDGLKAIDTNADGAIDAAEFDAAVAAGTLKAE